MRDRVIVLKFGGSVLAGPESLPRAVHEVHRWRRAGLGVVAVVSAFAGETDRRFAAARSRGASDAELARDVAGGEVASARALRRALARAGIPAGIATAEAIGLLAQGPRLDSAPCAVDRSAISALLADDGVCVVPGYQGVSASGGIALFGRGGSDLTALFLAASLGARCRLLKDVDGLYTADPATDPRARRYTSASFADAARTDGTILQPKAVAFARARGLGFEVAAAGAAHATLVGEASAIDGAGRRTARGPLRIALLGAGTVGGGVAALARGEPDRLEIACVATRERASAEALGLADRWTPDPLAAAREPVDVVVECLGGREPALSAIAAALTAGRDVVTANKRLVAAHGGVLHDLAAEHGVSLRSSAAVGGVMPVLERLATRAADKRAPVARLRGVLNGTANFLLNAWRAGRSHRAAVDDATARGLAERDWSRDWDGRDAADKLRVIAGVLGIEPGLSVMRTIPPSEIAARLAAASDVPLRQVVELDVAARRAHVLLEPIASEDPLHALPGAWNAVTITDADGAEELARGVGAGRWPTAESVLGDLLSIARQRAEPTRALAGVG